MTQPNDFAYPSNIIDPDGRFQPEYNTGLTKREYFAALALQGLCLEGAFSKRIDDQCEKAGTTTSQALAVYAVDLADELIKELNRK
jgi:hypothetical protein